MGLNMQTNEDLSISCIHSTTIYSINDSSAQRTLVSNSALHFWSFHWLSLLYSSLSPIMGNGEFILQDRPWIHSVSVQCEAYKLNWTCMEDIFWKFLRFYVQTKCTFFQVAWYDLLMNKSIGLGFSFFYLLVSRILIVMYDVQPTTSR